MVNGRIFWSLTARSFSLHFSKNGLMQVVEALWDKHGNATASNDGDVALALQCACNSSNPGAAVASLLSVMCSSGTASHPLVPAMLAAREPETGLPAIFLACQRGSACAVEQMCHAGATVQHADVAGRNLYHYLATYVPKLHPHTVLVVAAASCGMPSQQQPGMKCVAVRAPHGSELFVPKGRWPCFCGKHNSSVFCFSDCRSPEHLRLQLNARDRQGDTPLHTSIQQSRPCAVATFLLLGTARARSMLCSALTSHALTRKFLTLPRSVPENSDSPKQSGDERAARAGAAVESADLAAEATAVL